jgi:predicted HD superfamily hydrolase involved in NAD metabolism
MEHWNHIVLGLTPAIKSHFSPSRWNHTLGVVETAAAIAIKFPTLACPVDQVVTAALFHDIAKDLTGKELVSLIREHALPVDDVDLGFPAILHGPVGSWMAEARYNIADPVVLDAITHHTVGRPNPSPVLSVLMVADMVEPGRDFSGVDDLRRLAFSDPTLALRTCVERKLQHIIEKGRTPHPRAAAMLDSLRTTTAGTL